MRKWSKSVRVEISAGLCVTPFRPLLRPDFQAFASSTSVSTAIHLIFCISDIRLHTVIYERTKSIDNACKQRGKEHNKATICGYITDRRANLNYEMVMNEHRILAVGKTTLRNDPATGPSTSSSPLTRNQFINRPGILSQIHQIHLVRFNHNKSEILLTLL